MNKAQKAMYVLTGSGYSPVNLDLTLIHFYLACRDDITQKMTDCSYGIHTFQLSIKFV